MTTSLCNRTIELSYNHHRQHTHPRKRQQRQHQSRRLHIVSLLLLLLHQLIQLSVLLVVEVNVVECVHVATNSIPRTIVSAEQQQEQTDETLDFHSYDTNDSNINNMEQKEEEEDDDDDDDDGDSINHTNHEEENDDHTSTDMITTFYSIQELQSIIDHQQEHCIYNQSIYWMILIVQQEHNDDTNSNNNIHQCNKTTSTISKLYQNVSNHIQQWNNDWYPRNTHQQQSNTTTIIPVPYIHIGKFILSTNNNNKQQQEQSNSDMETLQQQLGIQSTPTIVLLVSKLFFYNTNHSSSSSSSSSNNSNNDKNNNDEKNTYYDNYYYGPILVKEYSGPYDTSTIRIANTIRHYFDMISHIRSQPVHQNNNNNKINTIQPALLQDTTTTKTTTMEQHVPRQFSSIHHLQQYIITYAERFFLMDRNRDDSTLHYQQQQFADRVVLSHEKLSLQERYYIKWLFENNIFDNYDTNTYHTSKNTPPPTTIYDNHEFVLLMIQCRTNHHPNLYQQKLYSDFDTMSRIISSRLDVLILTIVVPSIQKENDHNHDDHINYNNYCTVDGSIHVHEIPNRNYNDTIELLSQSPIEWTNLFVSYQYNPNIIPILNDDHSNSNNNNNNQTKPKTITTNDARLVEFIVKICTDTVLWFDRQMIAPIAFPIHRKVHAVLIVDMHYEIMNIVTNVYQPKINTDTNNTIQRLVDHPRTRMNQNAVTDFRRACRLHRIQQQQQSLLMDNDMVCLIVPSTETRILTTFGVTELWEQVDDAIVSFTPEMYSRNRNSSKINNSTDDNLYHHAIALPQLLITDQRYGGTRRYYNKDLINYYYYNQNDDTTASTNDTTTTTRIEKNPIIDFINQFWSNNDDTHLKYEIKSSVPPINEINEHGVHLLTANSIERKLYNNNTNNVTAALILFTSATCGHCKRIWTIWNRCSELIRNIQWDNYVQLYHIDVSENDILSTALNISIDYIPDVYYISKDRSKQIRYNIIDEYLGDTIGSIRDPYEIIHWLINDIGTDFMNEQQMQQLLYALDDLSSSLNAQQEQKLKV